MTTVLSNTWNCLSKYAEKYTDIKPIQCLPLCFEPSSHPLQWEDVLQPAMATAVSSPRTAPLIRFSWLKQKSHFQFPNPYDKTGGKTHTHIHTHTAVLTLLCLRRHFADTWWHIKPRLSIVLVFFFSSPALCFPQSWKSEYTPLAAQARLDCTTLRDGFIRCGFFSGGAVVLASF